jgi:hypothetical protein
MKFVLLLFTISIWSINLAGQIPFKGNYYIFDTIPHGDSTNYYLRYIEINGSELRCLIFPIIMINAEWVNSDDDRFNFGDLENVVSGKGKIFQVDKTYICNLLLSKGQDFYNNTAKTYIKESFLSIRYLSDSTLYINSKIFKKDSKLKIFQTFTGY